MIVLLHDLLQQITVFDLTLRNDKRILKKHYERRAHATKIIITYNRMVFNGNIRNKNLITVSIYCEMSIMHLLRHLIRLSRQTNKQQR